MPGQLIYLAAAYQRKDEMRGYAIALRRLGYRVEARWIEYGNHEADPEKYDHFEIEQFAKEDVEDIIASDWIMHFTGIDGKGGRNVEYGICLTLGKPMMIVGPREHVFHWVPGIMQAGSFSGALKIIETWEKMLKRDISIAPGRIRTAEHV